MSKTATVGNGGNFIRGAVHQERAGSRVFKAIKYRGWSAYAQGGVQGKGSNLETDECQGRCRTLEALGAWYY